MWSAAAGLFRDRERRDGSGDRRCWIENAAAWTRRAQQRNLSAEIARSVSCRSAGERGRPANGEDVAVLSRCRLLRRMVEQFDAGGEIQ